MRYYLKGHRRYEGPPIMGTLTIPLPGTQWLQHLSSAAALRRQELEKQISAISFAHRQEIEDKVATIAGPDIESLATSFKKAFQHLHDFHPYPRMPIRAEELERIQLRDQVVRDMYGADWQSVPVARAAEVAADWLERLNAGLGEPLFSLKAAAAAAPHKGTAHLAEAVEDVRNTADRLTMVMGFLRDKHATSFAEIEQEFDEQKNPLQSEYDACGAEFDAADALAEVVGDAHSAGMFSVEIQGVPDDLVQQVQSGQVKFGIRFDQPTPSDNPAPSGLQPGLALQTGAEPKLTVDAGALIKLISDQTNDARHTLLSSAADELEPSTPTPR